MTSRHEAVDTSDPQTSTRRPTPSLFAYLAGEPDDIWTLLLFLVLADLLGELLTLAITAFVLIGIEDEDRPTATPSRKR